MKTKKIEMKCQAQSDDINNQLVGNTDTVFQ